MPDDELARFLDHFHFIYPNLNDTFGYACADTERIAVGDRTEVGEPPSNQDMLIMVWRKFGHAGIVAFVATMRGTHPIEPLRGADYEAAREMLLGWSYEPD